MMLHCTCWEFTATLHYDIREVLRHTKDGVSLSLSVCLSVCPSVRLSVCLSRQEAAELQNFCRAPTSPDTSWAS